MKILVVDDSKTTILLITKCLEKFDHQVISTVSPIEALTLFQQEKPDLVLLDIVMDEMDGYECAKSIRQLSSENDWVPIIFLSAKMDDQSIVAAIEAGGDDYIIKPFTKISLEAKIKAMQRIANMRKKLFNTTQRLERAIQQLDKLSLTDELTRIANRRAFDQTLFAEWKRASRLTGTNSQLAIIMIDIDHFKLYNDTYGHQAGDVCLQKIANIIERSLTRSIDFLARYGGEEFVVILPNTDKDGALVVAERIRANVESEAIPHMSSKVKPIVTISAGVSSGLANSDITAEILLQAADKALYQAKEENRNCTRYETTARVYTHN